MRPTVHESDIIEYRELVLPYSEVCMHMKIAGKTMTGGLLRNELMVQLYDDDGRHFSFPITCGEAGWRRP